MCPDFFEKFIGIYREWWVWSLPGLFPQISGKNSLLSLVFLPFPGRKNDVFLKIQKKTVFFNFLLFFFQICFQILSNFFRLFSFFFQALFRIRNKTEINQKKITT